MSEPLVENHVLDAPQATIPLPRGPIPQAPLPRERRSIEIKIDGQSVSVAEGSTILDAAKKLGIETPTLCYLESLTPVNVCRVCVVELEGSRTLLVEDLATDGRSKVNFCNALRKAGAKVDHCFVLFYYDIFPGSKGHLHDLNVTLHYLATWWDVLDVAKKSGRFDKGKLKEVEKFMKDPSAWSKAHGGAAQAAE